MELLNEDTLGKIFWGLPHISQIENLLLALLPVRNILLDIYTQYR